MVFAHDTEVSLKAAVALVNTAGTPDTLSTGADLDEWYDEFGYTGQRRGDATELEEVRALRPMLRDLMTAERDRAAGLVNDLLAGAGAQPRLVRHAPFDWHLHAVSSDAFLATRIMVETAMAMVDVVRSDEMSRLAACGDDGCVGVVLDLSRNRSRRFCSTRCSNRSSVAAYRSRRAAKR